MIHSHLKTDEELLEYWNGVFSDKEQMQALEQLARRKIGNYGNELKNALEKGLLDTDEIQWTYFEYIYDNAFVIDYVNNPKPDYNVEKAIIYIQWAIPNHFDIQEYSRLNDNAKDGLLRRYLEELERYKCPKCDFEAYIDFYHHGHGQLQLFENSIKHVVNEGYTDFLEQSNDNARLMAIESKIAEMKDELHLSFIEWLYKNSYPNGRKNVSVRGSVKQMRGSLVPIEISGYHLLDVLKKILKKEGLTFTILPDTYLSYEQPNSIKYPHDYKDLFDTENLLGCYIPDKQEIWLYEIGIQWCAERLRIDADKLREIVLIHEVGHYMQHKMQCYQTIEWDDYLYIASYSPIDLHEGWAQLMDAWVVKNEPDYYKVFNSLVAVQSNPYQIYKNYVQFSPKCILKSLDGLRQLERVATIQDWDSML